MKLFKKNDKILDLTEHLKKQQEKLDNMREDLKEATPQSSVPNSSGSSGGSFFSFLGNSQKTNPEPTSLSYSTSENSDEKKRKLAKRLATITEKLEELSNSIYKIEQRLELIERKMNLGRY